MNLLVGFRLAPPTLPVIFYNLGLDKIGASVKGISPRSTPAYHLTNLKFGEQTGTNIILAVAGIFTGFRDVPGSLP